LRAFAGLPTVKVESATELSLALNGLEHGIDFADALHVARAAHCEAFVTFDRKFANRAKAVSPIPVLSAYTKVRAS
jgi:predicted nucleic acid-binding protein